MIRVNSVIKMNWGRIQALTEAQITALEQTAEYLHTEVVQAQVMPFDDPRVEEYKVYGKRGQFAKNGREYKGKIKKRILSGGHLQNDSTFVDYSNCKSGKATLVSSTPYARRLYFHPEYNFDKGENPNAGGKWLKDWLSGGSKDEDCQRAYKQLYKRITRV